MIERTSPRFAVHRSGPFDLLLRTRQVKLGGVLDEQDEINLVDSLARPFDVRLEDLLGGDFLVVEESACENDWNSFDCCFCVNPIPVS